MKRAVPFTRFSLCLALLATGAAADSIRQITLPTHDLITDPVTQQIYASVPNQAGNIGNSVVSIDPTTGVVGSPIPVGSDPGKLAIADGGEFLYVALPESAGIGRVDLRTRQVDLRFSLGVDPIGGNPLELLDMAVAPGHPETVAVSRLGRNTHSFEGIAVYDNGIQRPVASPRLGDTLSITFGASAARLYTASGAGPAPGFERLAVDTSGVSVLDATPGLIIGPDPRLQFVDGRLYTSTGWVIDPEGRALVGHLPDIDSNSYLQPDATVGRVFALTRMEQEWTLIAYDQFSLLPLGSLVVPGVIGQPYRLIRWGEDGLAFATSTSQVFLIRTALVPTEALALTLAPPVVTGGLDATGTILLHRPAPAGGTTVALSSYHPALSVPPAVTVLARATQVSFPIRTKSVSAAAAAEITASSGGVSRSALLQLLSQRLVSLTMSRTSVTGGSGVTASISLDAPAPAGGVTVALGSDNPVVAPVEASVSIPAGEVTARFRVPSTPVAQSIPVIVSATAGGITLTANLTVLPPHLSLMTLKEREVPGGWVTEGTIGLNGPAPAAGITVQLNSGNLDLVSVRTHILVPADRSRTSFQIFTRSVEATTSVPIAAHSDGVVLTATLILLPNAFATLTFNPDPVTGGSPTTGLIILRAPAPKGGALVTLFYQNATMIHGPESVTVPGGATAMAFTITTTPVNAPWKATITANYRGTSQTAVLTILPPSS